MTVFLQSVIPHVGAFIAAPLLMGVINRAKAIVAGRQGAPLIQGYSDIWKLLRKGAVYSPTTTWVFRAGPTVGLAAASVGLFLLPMGSLPAPLAFEGDLIALAALFGLGRFFTMLAALDTGSAFEGMGASREAMFSALGEPAFYLSLTALALLSHDLSLAKILSLGGLWDPVVLPVALCVIGGLLLAALAENSRIPVDDPNTHLELTMVHEVMVLDHSGPDLAFITYSASLKLLLFAGLLVDIALPWRTGGAFISGVLFFAGVAGVAVIIGIVESSMARLRMARVPQLLLTSALLGGMGVALALGLR